LEDRSTQKDTDMAFGMLSPDSQLENPTGSYTPVLGTCNEFVSPFLFSLCKCVHDGKLLLQRYGVTVYMMVNSSYRDMG